MNHSKDEWDQDEREALAGLESQLAQLREKHRGDPSPDLIAAARGGALPDDLQNKLDARIAGDEWTRTLADGLDAAIPELDEVGQARILSRISRQVATPPQAGTRRWLRPLVIGSALAASVLLIIVVSRQPSPPVAPAPTAPVAGTPAVAPLALAFDAPDIRMSPAVLTWRGPSNANTLLNDLKPAMDAYRERDYARADEAFAELERKYSTSAAVRFYAGATRMQRGDFAGAIAPLDAAIAADDDTFTAEARWLAGVAVQRAGRRDDARARLAALCAVPALKPWSGRACAAVAQIDGAR